MADGFNTGSTYILKLPGGPGAFPRDVRAFRNEDQWYPEKTISGVVKNDSNENIVRIVRAYERVTGRLIGQTISASDGTFTIDIPVTTECYLVCLDDEAGDMYNDICTRVLPS